MSPSHWTEGLSLRPVILSKGVPMSEPLLEPSMALSLEEFVALSNPAEEDLQVSLEALQYAPYFRQFGAIRAVQLAAPKLNKLADLQLSKLRHYQLLLLV